MPQTTFSSISQNTVTQWFPEPVKGDNESAFLQAACKHLIITTLSRKFRRMKRTRETVRLNYDEERAGRTWSDFEDYVFMTSSPRDFILWDGKVRLGSFAEVRGFLLQYLREQISTVVQPGDTIIEIGSGDGRNLVWLKRMFPSLRCIGVELSPTSVEVSRKMARQFKTEIEFHAADATQSLQHLPRSAVVFSSHALEQMPDIFTKAVDNMLMLADRRGIFLEPVQELYPWGIRGTLSRYRAIHMNRLRGLYRYVLHRGVRILEARALMHAVNPLNETCAIIVDVNGSRSAASPEGCRSNCELPVCM